jgi:hypothetical protein
MKTDKDAMFLDTSIVIARAVHSPEMKARINERLKAYNTLVSSLIVKQEFKRRMLKEAQYLLKQLNDKGSYGRVLRHVTDVLPPQQARKRTICLQMLVTIFEGATDEELTERAQRYLRQLMRVGLSDFINSVDHIVWQSGCACSNYPVAEEVPYKRYNLGPEKCSRVASHCGITAFLSDERLPQMKAILDYLKAMPLAEKSSEIQGTEAFLEIALANPEKVSLSNPCLTVGDLLIALESAGIGFFYTLNREESQHFCLVLKQSLIVRPKNPKHEDVIYARPEQDF